MIFVLCTFASKTHKYTYLIIMHVWYTAELPMIIDRLIFPNLRGNDQSFAVYRSYSLWQVKTEGPMMSSQLTPLCTYRPPPSKLRLSPACCVET